MKAIDKRISISALGGVLLAIGIMRVLNQPTQQDLIFVGILATIGVFLIYKGRYF